jgi:hypothetical protein
LSEKKPLKTRLIEGLRHAFALDGPHGPLTEEDRELIGRLAGWIAKRGLALPAMLFLESIKPLNSIGSQAMVFLRPYTNIVFKPAEYDRFTAVLERREGIGALVDAIETARLEREGGRL